jgi:hypothetical protein
VGLACFWAVVAALIGITFNLAMHVLSHQLGFQGFAPLASFNDDKLYWGLSQKIQEENGPSSIIHIYPVLLAGLFDLFGRHLFLGKAFNTIAYATTVFFGVLAAREVSLWKQLPTKEVNLTCHLVGMLFSFYPSQLFYSTQLFKDPPLVCAGIANFYFTILLLKGGTKNIGAWVGWVLSLGLLYNLRPYAAISLILGVLAYLVFVWKTKPFRKLLVTGSALAILAVLPMFFGLGLFASDYLAPWLNPEKISELREGGYSAAGSSSDITIDYSNPLLFLITFALSFGTTLLGPFLWQVRSIVQIVALPEALIASAFIVRLITMKHRKTISLNPVERIPLLCCLLSVGFIALFSDNIGATSRLRMLAWDLLFIYIAVSIASYRLQKRLEKVKHLKLISEGF